MKNRVGLRRKRGKRGGGVGKCIHRRIYLFGTIGEEGKGSSLDRNGGNKKKSKNA